MTVETLSQEERSKVHQAKNIDKETLFAARTEKVEMTLNTDSALAQGLLIQRLTELYEDPIEATVRETVSNAIDAVSVATSGDEPIVNIYQPTTLSPVFIVKDNGVGMTYDDLKNVYSKYGASTKADDLEQIGAYGLGAKAPLSYGTEFTVTSVKDGEKTTIMVAREEMTNFIKIVESKETDEPTGTTVSIPLKSSDVSRFCSNIKKYEETPLDKNVKIFIDDEMVYASQYTLLSDKVVTYEGSETVTGRIWIKNENIIQLLSEVTVETLKDSLEYVIGGWKYVNPASRRGYRTSYGIVVELKAGIVGFNSARDAILQNDKYDDLESLVVNYIASNNFVDDVTKMINGLELSEFKLQVSSLLGKNRRWLKIESGRIFIDTTGNVSNYRTLVKRKFELEKFIHNETGFKFDDVIKNVPKMKQINVILQETKDYGSKTSSNQLFMNSDNFSMFDTTSVKELNEYIDEVFDGSRESHDLENFMVNLSTKVYNPRLTKELSLTFVTDINEESELKKLKTARKSIVRTSVENDSSYTAMVVYTDHKKESIEKMISGLGIEELITSKIVTGAEALEEVKEFRKQNKVSSASKPIGLQTEFLKMNLSGGDPETASISSLDKNKENLIIISKDRNVRINKIIETKNWFCNTKDISAEDVDVYVSCGFHRNSDLNVIIEATSNFYVDKYSDKAGTSQLYINGVHTRRADTNSFIKRDITSKEESLVRMFMGVSSYSAERFAESLNKELTNAYAIADVASFSSMPEFPADTISKIKGYQESKFPDTGRYYDWALSDESISDLASDLTDSQIEVFMNVNSILDNRRMTKDGDKFSTLRVYSAATDERILISEAYSGGRLTKLNEKLVKDRTESYLNYIKAVVEELVKVNF